MTSQAYGKRDLNEVTRILIRAIGTGFCISFLMIILQYPIQKLAFTFIDAPHDVQELAIAYFSICIWGAPAVLGLYGFSGWFIGMQNSRFPMFIAIAQNIINIIASLSFVFFLKMKVEGVALGTLIAQYAGLIMAFSLWNRFYGKLKIRILWSEIIQKGAIKKFFQTNNDIFFRTLCHHILHLNRSKTGGYHTCCQYFINAIIYTVFIYHGRICICRRSSRWQIYRSQQQNRIQKNDSAAVHLGNCLISRIHSIIWHRWQRFPQTTDK